MTLNGVALTRSWSFFSLLFVLCTVCFKYAPSLGFFSFVPLLGVLCIEWGKKWGFLVASLLALAFAYRIFPLKEDPLFLKLFLCATFSGFFLFYLEKSRFQENIYQLESRVEKSQGLEKEREQLKTQCQKLTSQLYADTALEPSYEEREQLQEWKVHSQQLEEQLDLKTLELTQAFERIAELEEECLISKRAKEEQESGAALEATALLKQLQRFELQKQTLETHTQALYELISYLSTPKPQKKTSSKQSP